MSRPFNDRVKDLNHFVDRLLLHIADGGADLTAALDTDKTQLDPVSGFERTFEVELAGTGTRVVVSSHVLDDRKDFAYVRCMPCSQSGYLYNTVTGSGTVADIKRVVASIRQCLQARHRHGGPKKCSGCENPIAFVPSGLNQYRCSKGHEFVLKEKAASPKPNIPWTHELVAVDGKHETCAFGKNFDADLNGNVRTLSNSPALEYQDLASSCSR